MKDLKERDIMLMNWILTSRTKIKLFLIYIVIVIQDPSGIVFCFLELTKKGFGKEYVFYANAIFNLKGICNRIAWLTSTWIWAGTLHCIYAVIYFKKPLQRRCDWKLWCGWSQSTLDLNHECDIFSGEILLQERI